MKNLELIRKVMRNDLVEDFAMVIIFIVLIFLSLLTSSCSNNDVRPEKALLQAPELARSNKLNDRLFQKSAELTGKASDYKIGAEDLLEIEIFQAQELKTTARVSSQGYIKLPLGEKIKAAGFTVSELESRIAGSLKQYMVEPMVSVFVKEYRSHQISVLGYVKTPSVYYVSGQKTLLDMLSMAGGLTPEGADTCIIQRTVTSGKDGSPHTESIVVDLNELLLKGRAELNIPVEAGDLIHVPKAGVFFVDGAVGSPGLFPLKGTVTLVEALSMAKGLVYDAAHGSIRIYRDNGKPEREVIKADYDSILDGKSKDVELKDKDIIIVGTSGLKSLIKGLAGTANFGMFSVGRGY